MTKQQRKNNKVNTKPKKRSKGNLAYSISMVILTVAFAVSLFVQYQVKLDLNAQQKEVQAQLNQEEKKKTRLTNESKNQDSEEFVEKIAREKLNMVKPNEIVFIDKNNKDDSKVKNNSTADIIEGDDADTEAITNDITNNIDEVANAGEQAADSNASGTDNTND